MFDILIKSGTVVDGTGRPGFRADVGIRRDRIVAVGQLDYKDAGRIIEAEGLLVVPGFIDAHGHSDFSVRTVPTADSQILQGITTEVMGHCGYSAFPLTSGSREMTFDPQGVRADWETMSEYVQLVEQNTAINLVPLVGHCTLRAAVIGREERPLTASELDRLKELLSTVLEDGAVGMSTGLEYNPGRSAGFNELLELTRVLGKFGAVYATHLRGYTGALMDSVEEALELGLRAGVPVNISHMVVYGRKNWGRSRDLLNLIRAYRDRGVEVVCDIESYPTLGVWWAPRAILPEWAYDWTRDWEQELPRIQEIIDDPKLRVRLVNDIEARRMSPKDSHQEIMIFHDWDQIYLQGTSPDSPNRKHVGRALAEIARDEGTEPCDVFLDLIESERADLSVINLPIDLDDYRRMATDPHFMFSTDSLSTAIGRTSEPFNVIQSHPRHYGTFPRVIATLVREQGWLTLEEAVRKSTLLPAEIFRISERGAIRPGMYADVTVLDQYRIKECATYNRPRAYPAGIEWVIVNGVVAVERGQHTGNLAGRVLART